MTRVLALVLVLGCGGSAEPATQQTVAPPPRPTGPPPPAVIANGEIGGRPFRATAAALIFGPFGWTLTVADRPPDDAGELPLEATDMSFTIGRGEIPLETNAEGTAMNATATLGAPSPGADRTRLETVADFQVQLADVQRNDDNPDEGYPQVVGRARARFRATFRSSEGAPMGGAEGDLGTIPIIVQTPPESACRTSQPAPAGVAWTDAPSSRSVPDAPLAGAVRGRAFNVQGVRLLKTREGRWRFEASDQTFEPTAHMASGQFLHVDLEGELRRRARLSKPIAAGGGMWQICDGWLTTSWNADNAHYLEITSWTVTPPTVEPGQRAAGGTASGRVYITYRGSDPAENSWLAGTFTDIPVVFEGAAPQ